MRISPSVSFRARSATLATLLVVVFAATRAMCGGTNDPLIDLLIKKGVISQDEASQVQAEAAALSTNEAAMVPPSKWKISDGIKSVEMFGDLRMRYEYRSANTPVGDAITQRRLRYAFRFGLRGDLADDFYYGFRLETASNPRSPWVTFATSSAGIPYNGPYGKSTAGINVGQIYFGWRPESWLDVTVGKMPMPLYTTPMVWDSDINPEGIAEHLTYTVGDADLFANFGQFLYQELDPSSASPDLGFNGLVGQNTDNIWQFAWQGGFTYHFESNIDTKVAATIYQYKGMETSTLSSPNVTSPFFGDPYVGEGAYVGPSGTFPNLGESGYGTSSTIPGNSSLGFPNNQVGLNNLLVLEIPFEVNFKFDKVDTKLFGDFGYNLEGRQRAEAAAAGYATYLSSVAAGGTPVTVTPFSPQKNDVKAYQFGFAIASKGNLGLVYGTSPRKNAWEFRTYWQHVEQYALDANILDSDFFEGRANLEGLYLAAAYGLSPNIIGTVRGGLANRINGNLGTGGSNQDIPWINPIERYRLLQFDLTYKF